MTREPETQSPSPVLLYRADLVRVMTALQRLLRRKETLVALLRSLCGEVRICEAIAALRVRRVCVCRVYVYVYVYGLCVWRVCRV